MSGYKIAQRNVRGWSLVEMLIVVSVISILFALVITSGITMVKKSNILKCATNLRYIGMALNSYANDHDGFYPNPYDSTRIPPYQVTWMTAIETYLEYPEKSMGSPPLPRMVGVFICPELTEENIKNRQAGYFYNSTLMLGGVTRPNLRRSKASHNTFLVVEGQPKNAEGQSATVFLNSPPDRHHKGAVSFLHVDGRVETLYPPFNPSDPRWTMEGE